MFFLDGPVLTYNDVDILLVFAKQFFFNSNYLVHMFMNFILLFDLLIVYLSNSQLIIDFEINTYYLIIFPAILE